MSTLNFIGSYTVDIGSVVAGAHHASLLPPGISEGP